MLRRRHLRALQHCDHVRVQQILGAIGMNGTLRQLLLLSDSLIAFALDLWS